MTVAVQTPSQTIVVRSNRPLTEFACKRLDAFLESRRSLPCTTTQGNTTVLVRNTGKNTEQFAVFLFSEEIMSISRGVKGMTVRISFTSYYDYFGQPTTTTAERLNGLLDRLGCHGVIPEGVRIFRGGSEAEPVTYIGQGSYSVPVGRGLADSVYVIPSHSKLDILATQISHDVA